MPGVPTLRRYMHRGTNEGRNMGYMGECIRGKEHSHGVRGRTNENKEAYKERMPSIEGAEG